MSYTRNCRRGEAYAAKLRRLRKEIRELEGKKAKIEAKIRSGRKAG